MVPLFFMSGTLFSEAFAVAADGLADAPVEGVADDGVADGHFVEEGYLLVEVGQVLGVEVVAGVESQSCVVGRSGGGHEGGYGLFASVGSPESAQGYSRALRRQSLRRLVKSAGTSRLPA